MMILFLLFSKSPPQERRKTSFSVPQTMAITGGTPETLDQVPARVWEGLPDCLRLGPSAVNQSRVGA